MKWNFKDKKIVITGGASGIGKKIATDFAKNGAYVAILDINEEDKDRVVTELKELSQNDIRYYCGSIADKAFVDDCFQDIFEIWGDIDFLVNCAGILRDFMSYRFDEKKWDFTMQVNLKGTAIVTQAAAANWVALSKKKAKDKNKKKLDVLENPPKVIVNISSLAAEGNIGQLAYSTSKAGIIGMTKTLAKELVKYNIRTHAVQPNLIDTPIIGDLLEKNDGKFKSYYSNRIPFGIGKPRYVSDVVCFLCSEGGFYMNGCIIPINGGKLEGL